MAKIKNEKKFKCVPQQLCMSEASPFCQPWSYASDHPMDAMLAKHYFMAETDRLRAGDTIRIAQMEEKNVHARDNKVLAFVDVTILSSSREGVEMEVTFSRTMGEAVPVAMDSEAEDLTEINSQIKTLNEISKNLETRITELSSTVGNLGNTMSEIQPAMTMSATPGTLDLDSTKGVSGTGDQGGAGSEEKPRREWNPGKRVHEAVTGEGDDKTVLFSHAEKAKVDEWLQSLAS